MSNISYTDLFSNQTGAAQSGQFEVLGPSQSLLVLSGTFATLKLQALAGDGTTWVDVSGLTWSAVGGYVINLGPGIYRADVDATASAVYARLY